MVPQRKILNRTTWFSTKCSITARTLQFQSLDLHRNQCQLLIKYWILIVKPKSVLMIMTNVSLLMCPFLLAFPPPITNTSICRTKHSFRIITINCSRDWAHKNMYQISKKKQLKLSKLWLSMLFLSSNLSARPYGPPTSFNNLPK